MGVRMNTVKMRAIDAPAQPVTTRISRQFNPRRGRFVNYAVADNSEAQVQSHSRMVIAGQKETKMENGTYMIGRQDRRRQPRLGPQARRENRHPSLIWVNDETVSNRHAELDVLNEQLYLRDLESTNGTYLEREGRKEPFKEGYVNLDQTVHLGQCVCTIRQLLEST